MNKYAGKAVERSLDLGNRATPNQIKAMEKLFNDCGFSTRLLRNDYIRLRFRKEIKYLDELTFQEADRIIKNLISRKEE